MGSKAFLFLGLAFAIVVLISSEVSARDLAETSKNEVAKEVNGVEEGKHGGGGYYNGGGHGGGGYYNGGGGYYNGGGRHGGGGYNNGGGRYGGGCRYGRCCGGRGYYHGGGGCRCCSSAAEAAAEQAQAQPHN